MTSDNTTMPQPGRGRLFLLLGCGLAVLGVPAYGVQMWLERLVIPWYMPVLAWLGVALIVVSLIERRTVWRLLGLFMVILLAGAECAFLYAMRQPPYTGPITVGRPFPTFASSRADGAAFTQRDLVGEQNSVLVFFRGRW